VPCFFTILFFPLVLSYFSLFCFLYIFFFVVSLSYFILFLVSLSYFFVFKRPDSPPWVAHNIAPTVLFTHHGWERFGYSRGTFCVLIGTYMSNPSRTYNAYCWVHANKTFPNTNGTAPCY
jgi:hypothetical protein